MDYCGTALSWTRQTRRASHESGLSEKQMLVDVIDGMVGSREELEIVQANVCAQSGLRLVHDLWFVWRSPVVCPTHRPRQKRLT